jgi:hypothetical protein
VLGKHPVIGGGIHVVACRGDQIEPPTIAATVGRALKSAHEEALE